MASATVKARATLRSVFITFGGFTMLELAPSSSIPESHLMISGSSGMSRELQGGPSGKLSGEAGKVTLVSSRLWPVPTARSTSSTSMAISRLVLVEQLKGEPTRFTMPEAIPDASCVDTWVGSWLRVLPRLLTLSRDRRDLSRTLANMRPGRRCASASVRARSANSPKCFARSSLMLYMANASFCNICCRSLLTCPARLGIFLSRPSVKDWSRSAISRTAWLLCTSRLYWSCALVHAGKHRSSSNVEPHLLQ
mmetsp:Transcript_10017/g.20910  ORF Transcript_10017/g.20910 Transcript_10017/m.20910 type:complete len:252 (-) Transcript_10017:292-1047(-)